jgi:hypothetical protein
VVGGAVTTARRKYCNSNKEERAGTITDVKMIPGGNFVYDVKYPTGFGATERDVPEVDLRERVEQYEGRASRRNSSTPSDEQGKSNEKV